MPNWRRQSSSFPLILPIESNEMGRGLSKYYECYLNNHFRFGETTMHIAKECINFYNVAFSVPYNSKYKDVFDKKIGQILEAGLIGKYIENEMDKTAKKIKSATSKAIVIPLSLFHLEAPLILLPILLGISFFVFCIEYVSGK